MVCGVEQRGVSTFAQLPRGFGQGGQAKAGYAKVKYVATNFFLRRETGEFMNDRHLAASGTIDVRASLSVNLVFPQKMFGLAVPAGGLRQEV